MNDLPPGWTHAPLGELSRIIRGITFPATAKEKTKNSSNVCCLRTTNVQKELRWEDVYFVSRKFVKREDQFVRRGDVLMSMANSYDLVGKVAVVESIPYETAFGAFLSAVRPQKGLHGAYLFHFLRSDDVQRQIREGSSQTTNIANVSISRLGVIDMPVAPLAEQMRIASKLEAVLARVDACRERLDRVPSLLKRFRQAVLAAAAGGELTREWRKGAAPALVAGLPFGWIVTTVGAVGKVQLGRQRTPKFHRGTEMRPYLRVQNVFENRLDLADVMEMDFPGDDVARFELKPGDILLNEGQSPQFLGRPAMYRGELPGACFTNTLIRFQAKDVVRPEFALLVFRHHMHSGRYASEGSITTNIAHLGAGKFSRVEFPLPPLDEQDEIVKRAGELLSLADSLEQRLGSITASVARMIPAVLAKAFRGELVPQDPNDEPAAELLARIRRGRSSGAPAPRARMPMRKRSR